MFSILYDLGYDDEQANEFLMDDSIDYAEFAVLPVDKKVSKIRASLVEAGYDGDPANGNSTADELISANVSKRDRLLHGTAPNLLSSSFATNSGLSSITPLSTRINESAKTNAEEEEDEDKEEPDSRISIKDRSYKPGGEDDPYQLAYSNADDYGDDISEGGSAAVKATEVLSPPPDDSANTARLLESREQFQELYSNALNTFVDHTPLQRNNAVPINAFLTRTAQEEPAELERAKMRAKEVEALRSDLREIYNPNRVSVRDTTSYDNVRDTTYRHGDVDLSFERRNLVNSSDVDMELAQNSDSRGRADIEKTMRNVMGTISDNEESTLGGLLGNRDGTKSIGNSFTPEDYLKMCGVETMQDFQRLLDERINPPANATTKNDSILYDQTKLTFLPNEARPDMNFPPLGILPTNNEHKIIGTKALFGTYLGEGMIPADEVTPAQITTMEVDEGLLSTNEANIHTQTGSADVNVMSEVMLNSNYARTLQNI